MLFTRVSHHMAQRNSSKNLLLYNQVRGKSIQNWKRPTMNEYLGPKESYEQAYAKKQVVNNYYFGLGFGFLGFTCVYGLSLDLLPYTVDPYTVKIVSQNLVKPIPVTEEDDSDEDIEDGTVGAIEDNETPETVIAIEEDKEVSADVSVPVIAE